MKGERRIGLREVRALRPGEIAWDAAVPGFGARRQKDAVTYVLKYRTSGRRQRWHTIGRHGAPWTPDTAREEARRLVGEVAKGGDPAADKQAKRHAVTVGELCQQRYLADAEAGRLLVRGGRPKKISTLLCDRGRVEGHIVPLLGRLPVAAVTKQDVERFMHDVAAAKTARQRKTRPRGVSRIRGGRGVATRTIGLLGAIFAYGVDHGMRADNPAHRVRKFAENKRERRLGDAEYGAFNRGLRLGGGTIWPPAVACARFLALTGWRSGEALAGRGPRPAHRHAAGHQDGPVHAPALARGMRLAAHASTARGRRSRIPGEPGRRADAGVQEVLPPPREPQRTARRCDGARAAPLVREPSGGPGLLRADHRGADRPQGALGDRAVCAQRRRRAAGGGGRGGERVSGAHGRGGVPGGGDPAAAGLRVSGAAGSQPAAPSCPPTPLDMLSDPRSPTAQTADCRSDNMRHLRGAASTLVVRPTRMVPLNEGCLMEWRALETFSFGDNPALADELAALVLKGRKHATCWAASQGKLTEVGKRMAMLDGAGRPRAVLETVELTLRRFGEVDAAFAHDEGEGDQTLAFWRQAHRAYFGRRCQFAEDIVLWCERFRVVQHIVEEEDGRA